jgi:hypothetical protein
MLFKDLSKKELAHLKAQGISTLRTFTHIAKEQKRMREEGGEPCFECKNIARKLNLPI